MLTCLMLDVDGVLVDGRPSDGLRWDQDLTQDFEIAKGVLGQAFFKASWRDVVIGKMDLLPALRAALAPVAPKVNAEALIAYWFARDARVMTEVLDDVRTARAHGLRVYLTTNQEHLRAQYLMQDMGLAAHVDGMVYSAAVGCKKPELAFYRAAEKVAGDAGQSLLLVDDRTENIDAARAAGWQAVHWDASQRLDAILDACNQTD